MMKGASKITVTRIFHLRFSKEVHKVASNFKNYINFSNGTADSEYEKIYVPKKPKDLLSW